MNDKKVSVFDDLVKLSTENLKPVLRELRKLILSIDPDAHESVSLGYKAATYGLGPKKMSEGYCHIALHKSWVNLGFFQGAHLPDPESLLEGTGKNIRHVKIRTIEQISQPAIKALIQAALSERRHDH